MIGEIIKSRGNKVKTIALAIAVFCGLAFSTQASTILTVSGETSPSSPAYDAVNSPGLSGVGFNIASDLTDLSFTVDFICSGVCLVDAYLLNNIGPTTTLSNVFATVTLDGSTTTAFSGVDLVADDYAIMLTSNEGIFSWNASAAPTIFYGGPASPLNNIVSSAYNATVPFASSVVAVNDLAFLYSIEQNVSPPTPVPLGHSAPMLATGLLGMAIFRRRTNIRAIVAR
jgi:hypothetical protein